MSEQGDSNSRRVLEARNFSGLTINFRPQNGDPRFLDGTKEYEEIWREDGNRITSAIERLSGLKFLRRPIPATVYDGISYSHPLHLNSELQTPIKKGVLVHELIHRIIKSSKPTYDFSQDDYLFSAHKLTDLILYDAWVEIYGEDLARENVAFENEIMNENGNGPYKRAWVWALGMTREKRQAEFRKYFQPHN